MSALAESTDPLQVLVSLAGRIEKALQNFTEDDLDLRGGAEGWSIRETVHHLVESNLIASNIIIASLAKSGCVYDWSWVTPSVSWMQHLGYNKAPIRPALQALKAISEHMAALIRASSDGLLRTVQLLDAPGAKPYTKTVKEVLTEQIGHVEGHLRTVAEIRASHGK